MGKSQTVRVTDVARILRLANQLDELPSALPGRMQLVAEAGCRLLGAKLGTVSLGEGFTSRSRPRSALSIPAGWADASEQAVFARYAAGDLSDDPCVPVLAARPEASVAARREQLVADDQWYGNGHVNEDRRAAGVDDVIYSMRRLRRPGAVQCIAVHRPWGDIRPFTARDRTLLRLIHLAVAPKLRQPTALTRPVQLARQLPPRLRETLQHLLLGESEKQIASELGISQHTLHGYVKIIYSHFDATSRAELMAQWVDVDDNAK